MVEVEVMMGRCGLDIGFDIGLDIGLEFRRRTNVVEGVLSR